MNPSYGNQGFQKQNNGSREFLVQMNTGTTVSGNYIPAIQAGMIVARIPGTNYVIQATAGMPVVGTDFIVGIASSFSFETATNDGLVAVTPLKQGEIYRFTADVSLKTGATSIVPIAGTVTEAQAQTNYNLLIGKRVVFGTADANGVLPVLGVDGATKGLIVEYHDINAHLGVVSVSMRDAVKYTA